MKKYKNKYRIPSARLKGWDYRNEGAYFITICTKNREHFFGECKDSKMTLSTMGAIVQGFWFEIPKHADHVQLGEFVVMPNHVHGILILSEMKKTDDQVNVVNGECDPDGGDPDDPEPNTKHPNREFFQKISPKSGSVSRILQQYKRVCKIHNKTAFPEANFNWQERFYDHIIRNDQSFNLISNYIVNNPKNWKEDKFFDK